jgi:hypothetical protein
MERSTVLARRTLLGRTAFMVSAMGLAAVTGRAADADRSGAYEGPVIDFRVRPPWKSFRKAFHAGVDPSVPDQALLEDFLQAMQESGIRRAVLMGRTLPASGFMGQSIPNDDIVELCRRHPGTFEGFGSLDVRDPRRALDELHRCHDQGLKGIAFDNPMSELPLHDDDPSLFAIYEECARLGMIISLTSSILVGPSIDYSHPRHIQAVATRFPETPVVVPHASWPWIRQLIAVALQGKAMKVSRVYLMPDFYFSQDHAPGRGDIVDAARFGLADRILYASSVPALDMPSAARHTRQTADLDAVIKQQIMYANALSLLGEDSA